MDELNKKIIYYGTIDALAENQANALLHIAKAACITQRQLGLRVKKSDWSHDEIKRLCKKFGHEFTEYIRSQF